MAEPCDTSHSRRVQANITSCNFPTLGFLWALLCQVQSKLTFNHLLKKNLSSLSSSFIRSKNIPYSLRTTHSHTIPLPAQVYNPLLLFHCNCAYRLFTIPVQITRSNLFHLRQRIEEGHHGYAKNGPRGNIHQAR